MKKPELHPSDIRKDPEISPLAEPTDGYKIPKSRTEYASSPPQVSCCLWCSRKRVPGKKDGRMESDCDSGDWGQKGEILSDFRTFSVKDQERKLKEALKEEEKMSKEAERVMTWVKQASARMEVSQMEHSLSDDERSK